MLNATQFLVQEQNSLVVSQVSEATSAISLNKALGGGWEGYEAPGPPPGPRPALIAAGDRLLHPARAEPASDPR